MLISTFGTSTIAIVLSLVTSVVLARSLGAESRGTLLALTFWPGMLVAILGLSVNESTAYHVARAATLEGARAAQRIEASALVVQLSICVVATLAVLALVPQVLPSMRHADLTLVMLYAAAFTPLTTLDMHFKSVLQGRGAFKRANALRLAQPIAYVAAILSLLFTRGLKVETVMVAMLVALGSSVLVGATASSPSLGGASIDGVRQSLTTGAKFHLANTLLYAAAEADKIIILLLMDDTHIGYYAIGIAISALGTGIVAQSLGLLITREMASATSAAERAGVVTRNLLGALFILSSANGIAAVTAPLWLPLIFGHTFFSAVPVTMILLIMGTMRGARVVLDRSMRAIHNTSVGVTGETVALVCLIIFGSLGGASGGLEGFAWGMAAAQVSAFAAMAFMTTRVLAIAPTQLLPLMRDNAILLGRKVWRGI